MFFKKLNLSWVLPILLALSGCTEMATSPVEQVQLAQKENKGVVTQTKVIPKRSLVKNQEMVLYICKDDKQVRILKSKSKKNVKNNIVNVTFMGTTHRLSPAVTKNGKKYSNIRWVWWEPRSGKAELYDNNKQILAEQCVKRL